jgi:exodeoxyribonuclease III
MKFVSWNVNGLRAVREKGFEDIFKEFNADFFCLQEIKLQEGQIDISFDGYDSYWNYAQKKGYSGTAIFTKHKPLNVIYGLGIEEHDNEGRLITLEYDNYYIATVYTPNAKQELLRLDYRQKWEDDFREFFKKIDDKKPVIICGDMNVAHQEIDLKNPKSNHQNPGFSDEEREKFTLLLDSGFIDTFRYFYPDKENEYSWWSYRGSARKNNTGWRIDYFLVSDRLKEKLKSASIHQNILGSDHCPVSVEIEF